MTSRVPRGRALEFAEAPLQPLSIPPLQSTCHRHLPLLLTHSHAPPHSCCSNHQVQQKLGVLTLPKPTMLLLASMHSDRMSTTWGNTLLGTWQHSLWCMMSTYVNLNSLEKRQDFILMNSKPSAWASW